ncbi:E3 ubiquitin-protein ligase RNF13 isoform X1 [Colias croceus]|uniref:E3 ubiquitin-protein ligase RNF13 isoform X1 n=1 Tax=Colias crocea TaxID=72248 RepID=UPI001E27E3B8|nr:E3 ubiquitin-protein ligase RNF13 isoform X1 [Colias croceus]XP_045510690.1 E3 ubiquitin-protein ligase RNF13 isoform X1 [Colias croceus]
MECARTMHPSINSCLIGLLGFLTYVKGNVIVYTQDLPHTIAEEFRDMPASFGPEVPPDGLRGFLVPGEPADGCGPLGKPPAVENFTGKWIVIVARFNCSFEVKVRNAQAAGFDAAIVHNVNSSDLETMSAKDPEGIMIPSVFVSDLAGLILSEEYIYINRYYIMVNGDLPFNINTHLLLPFAIVVVLCLIVILIFMIVKCIKDRRRARRHRLPNRSLKKIPTCKFSKGDPYDTCAICLDDYQEGERLRVLPCAHAYHAKCIDPWLTQNRRVCPVCKRRVLAAGERRHSDCDSSDTEPLVRRDNTEGGTFEEQRENPFVRAARYVANLRLRREAANNAEEPQPTEDNEQSNTNQVVVDVEREVDGDESAALLPRSERRRSRRRERRERAAHSAHAQPARAAPPLGHQAGSLGSQAGQLTPQAGPVRTLRPAQPSINGGEGEIGVAALPAQPSTDGHIVNL